MDSNNINTHLTHEERVIIRTGIEHGSTKTAIAQTLGKDNSTIGKEIKLHRAVKYKCSLPLECVNYKHCKHERKCTTSCEDYEKFKCKRRDRTPGACNGCNKYSYCRFDKYFYNPEEAQREYEKTLVESREGFNITPEELKALGRKIQPLLKQGLSPYAILQEYPDLGVSEKTLYTYIESGAFKGLDDDINISQMDLRRQVGRKITKKKAKLYKKRQDRKFLIGRTFKDCTAYKEKHPDASVTQMDTVYNDETNGPFIQTFKVVGVGILLGVYQDWKTAESMTNGINLVEKMLGPEVFRKYAHILLTDRGSEFSAADDIETAADGTRRARIYYCDPMQSGQKGTLENNHIELRYILPKGTDLYALGLVDQDALNLVLSHVNSIPLEKFNGKTALEVAEFMYPDLYEKLVAFGIHKIPVKDLILKPYLLKNRHPTAKQIEERKRRRNTKKTSNQPAVTEVAPKTAEDVPTISPCQAPEVATVPAIPQSEKQEQAKQVAVPEAKKTRRHTGGRKPVPSNLTEYEIVALIAEGKSAQEIAEKMGVSVPTYYRRLAAMKKKDQV